MSAAHEKLVDDILLDLGSQPDIRCWRTQVGKYRAYSQPRRIITIGPKGKADIEGLLAPFGRAFYVEAKVGRDKQSDTQTIFEQVVTALGAIYIIAYSVVEARNGLDAARNNERI